MKKANESLSVGLGGFIISGTETNPKSNVQKTLQMKFQIVIKKNLNIIYFQNKRKKKFYKNESIILSPKKALGEK